ncbi:alpha/beta fold hydrolase [Nesterenkonia ebinurensis]|uniref:alpha/beta fold hydrolase n=1 Tax=Nesterenkonia ebinurensis TaxID=2608252 RepID=UPI00123E2593|nr:alpha/beta hydrolase [Nesterenkonia ebinurensis]
MYPVLGLHSLFFDGKMFDQLSQATGRTVLAPDHRGQGTRSAEEPGTVDELAGDVVGLLDTLPAPVHLVGSSMGAYVAMIVAATKPERVRTCTLSAATADAEQRPEKFDGLVAQLRDKGPAAIVEQIGATMFGNWFLRQGDAARDYWLEHFASLDTGVGTAAEKVFRRRELWAEVLSIRSPLLLLAGRQDTAKSPADMERISERTGASAPIVFEKSGHTPFVEQPTEVADVLAKFWQHHEERR